MNSTEFCYWLQGYFEMSGDVKYLDGDKLKMIQDHLNLVFDKQTEPFRDTAPTIPNTPGYNPYNFEPFKPIC